MRSVAFVLLTPLLACTATAQPVDQLPPDGQTTDGGSNMPPPAHGFQLTSPAIDVNPGVDITYCYYFHTSNTGELTIQRWASHMTSGVHDMILYLTTNDQQTPGTMTPADCGIAAHAGGPIWSYAAQATDAAQTTDRAPRQATGPSRPPRPRCTSAWARRPAIPWIRPTSPR